MEDWKRVIWSDECYIYLGDKKGDIWITRSADEVWDEDCLVPKFQQSSIRVMMWGCIAYGKKGPLIVLEYPGGKGGGMTALRYQQQVLCGPFYDFYEEMSKDRGYAVFQQDGASCHRAPSTMTWLSRHAIDIFPHTASSPDISPIEPVWKILKNIIRSRPRMPTTLEGLINATKESWAEIPQKDIDHQIELMPARCKALITVKGGHTKY